MNPDIMRKMGFGNEVDAVKSGRCPFCNRQTSEADFKDEKSKSEFKISGLCPTCQDRMFG